MRLINNPVHRSKAVEQTLQKLGGPNAVLFDTLREAMGFSAALGYREKRRLPLDIKEGKEDIQQGLYMMNEAVDLVFAIALAADKTIDVLKPENEKECIKIFEEYANGGLHLMQEWLDLYSDIDVEEAIWRGLSDHRIKMCDQS